MAKVAVVILNWNGREMMRQFLPSVISCSQGADIVVADNGSTDGSPDMLMRDFPEVRRVQLDRNYGFAEGYNQAFVALVRQYRSEGVALPEYYVLLNSDVEATPDWLTILTDFMDGHLDVAACQPKLRCQWNKGSFEYAGACGGYVDALGYPYCRGRLMKVVEDDCGQYDYLSEQDREEGRMAVYDCLWATGACLMIRRKDWEESGGLDGRFFAHQEEIDLCWRLRSRGRRVVCVTQSMVYHQGGGTLPQGNPRKDFLNFRNNLLLLYKNLPAKSLGRVMFVRFWLDALASLQFLLVGQFGSFTAVWRARAEFHRMRKEFEADRKENLDKTLVSPVPEQSGISLLWSYYVGGVRRFSDLRA